MGATFSIDDDLVDVVEEFRRKLMKRYPGMNITRSAAVRAMLHKAGAPKTWKPPKPDILWAHKKDETLPVKLRLNIVGSILCGNLTRKQASSRFNVNESTVRYWIRNKKKLERQQRINRARETIRKMEQFHPGKREGWRPHFAVSADARARSVRERRIAWNLLEWPETRKDRMALLRAVRAHGPEWAEPIVLSHALMREVYRLRKETKERGPTNEEPTNRHGA